MLHSAAVTGVLGAALLGLLAGMGMKTGDELQQDRLAPQLVEVETRGELAGAVGRSGPVPDYVIGTDNLYRPAAGWDEPVWASAGADDAELERLLRTPADEQPVLTAVSTTATPAEAGAFAEAAPVGPPSLGGGVALAAPVEAAPTAAVLTTAVVEPSGPAAD